MPHVHVEVAVRFRPCRTIFVGAKMKILDLFAGTRAISDAFEQRGGGWPIRSNGITNSRESHSMRMWQNSQQKKSSKCAAAGRMLYGHRQTAQHTAWPQYHIIDDKTATHSNQSANTQNNATQRTNMCSNSSENSNRNSGLLRTHAEALEKWTSWPACHDTQSHIANMGSAE